jgi:hypothetical protein
MHADKAGYRVVDAGNEGGSDLHRGGICLAGNVNEAKDAERESSFEGTDMRTMMTGFTGWVKMQGERSESARVVDTALTVVATLLVVTTWAVLHH